MRQDAEDKHEDDVLLAQIGDAEAVIRSDRHKPPGFFLARTTVRLIILGAGLGCAYLTFNLPPDSYAQSLLSNLTAGLFVFLAAAPTLRAMRAHPWPTLAIGVSVAGTVLATAYLASSVKQSLLLNAGVGIMLLLALDLNIARWLDALSSAERDARQRLAVAKGMIERAESALDYKYAVHDYLHLPRPDKLGGIRFGEGETLLGVLGWTDPDGSAT